MSDADEIVVGLISDTHDNLPLVRRSVAFFRARRPHAVFHLGDIASPHVVPLFAGLPARFVRGNNDLDPGLGETLAEGGFPPLADEWCGTLGGVDVAATHGHKKHLVHRHAGRADVLLHGHTHVRRAERVGPTLIVNPGALHRATRKTIALLHLPTPRLEWFEVTEDAVVPFDGPPAR